LENDHLSISENNQPQDFSKKQKKGRPRLLNCDMEAILKSSFSENKTHRSLQNKFYLLRSFRLIKSDPALGWLYQEGESIRATILSELGRIDRDEDLLTLARELCALKPKTRDAIILIRTFRKSKQVIAPPATREHTDPPTPIEPEQREMEPTGTGFAIWPYEEPPPKL
jgi:hypothetical protein